MQAREKRLPPTPGKLKPAITTLNVSLFSPHSEPGRGFAASVPPMRGHSPVPVLRLKTLGAQARVHPLAPCLDGTHTGYVHIGATKWIPVTARSIQPGLTLMAGWYPPANDNPPWPPGN